jgi:hypothetical protein
MSRRLVGLIQMLGLVAISLIHVMPLTIADSLLQQLFLELEMWQ